MADRKVIILIGPSGSGKSTRAEEIKKKINSAGDSCYIVSADNYFIGHSPLTPEYKFVVEKLPFAHDWCKCEFVKALRAGVNVVVVDNTNSTRSQRFFYEIMSKEFGFTVEYEEMKEKDLQTLLSRNIHGTPEKIIQTQLDNISKDR